MALGIALGLLLAVALDSGPPADPVENQINALAGKIRKLEGEMARMRDIARTVADLQPGPRKSNPALIEALKGWKAKTSEERALLMALRPMYAADHVVTAAEVSNIRSLALDAILAERE